GAAWTRATSRRPASRVWSSIRARPPPRPPRATGTASGGGGAGGAGAGGPQGRRRPRPRRPPDGPAVPRLTDDQARERAAALDGWEFRGKDIRKQYRFGGFKEAMAFVNRVAA